MKKKKPTVPFKRPADPMKPCFAKKSRQSSVPEDSKVGDWYYIISINYYYGIIDWYDIISSNYTLSFYKNT